MKKQILDQIIFDSNMTLEDEIMGLEQMPENFINSLYNTSYDEMTKEEKTESVEEVKAYLIANM